MFRKIIALFFAAMLLMPMIPNHQISTASTQEAFVLKTLPGNGLVMLNWSEIPGASEGYHVYRKVAETASWEGPLTDFGILGTTFFDTEVVNGNLYCYYVSALDSNSSEIARSNEVCAGPAESMPKIIEDCKMVLIFTLDSYDYLSNGVKKTMSTPFLLVGKRSYLAFRYVTEEVGGSIAWDGTQKKVTVKYKQVTIEMWVGKSTALVNGVATPIDPNDPKTTPFIKDGRTFVPLRFPVESFKEGEVKWFASTKQAVLSFPGRCEETREGVLAKYNSESYAGVLLGYDGNVYPIAILPESNYSPRVRDCLRVTGRNDNANYPGYLAVFKAELLECKSPWPGAWRAKIKSIDKTKLSIVVANLDSESQEMTIRLQQHQTSILQGLTVGECVFVVGIYVAPVNDTPYVKAYLIEEIPCEETNPNVCKGKWLSGTIKTVDCVNGMVEVSVKGETLRVFLPGDSDCLRLKPGFCVRFCGDRSGKDIKATIFKAFPCDSPVCDGDIYRGRILNIDCQSMKLIISLGDTFNEFDISGMDCESIKALDPSCVKVCAIGNGDDLVAISVTQGNPEECSRYCQGRTIQATIARIDCEKGIIYATHVSNGSQLELFFEDPSLCKLVVDKCYEICLKPNTDRLFAISATLIECPDLCDGEVFIGAIKSFDCQTLQAVLLTKTGKEVQIKLNSVDCKRLANGQCVKICAIRDLTGAYKATSVKFLDASECKPATQPCKDTLAIVHILKVDCEKLIATVKVVEAPFGVGMEFDMPVDSSFCSKLSPGMCIRACFKAKGMFDFELVSWEEIPPEKCGISVKCDKEVVGRLISCGDGTIAIDYYGKTLKYSIDNSICSKLAVGDCVKICFEKDKTTGNLKILKIEKAEGRLCENQKCVSIKGIAQTITGDVVYLSNGKKAIFLDKSIVEGISIGDCVELCIANDKLVWATKLDPKECEQKCDKTINIKIQVVNCENLYLEGLIFEDGRYGQGVKIFFESHTRDIFCKLGKGGCYRLCVTTNDNGAMIAIKADPIDCPTRTCNGRNIKGEILRVNCNEYVIFAEFDGQARMLMVKQDICEKIEPGACVRMCIEKDEYGNLTIIDFEKLDYKECSSAPCNGKTMVGKVSEATEDKEGLLVRFVGQDVKFRIGRNKESGKILFIVKPGQCIEACYTYDFRNEIPSILSVEILPDGECDRVCEEKLWQGTITRLLCDRNLVVMTRNGVLYNVKVSEEICSRLEEGMCVIACGQWSMENQVFTSNWIRILPYDRCHQEGQVIIGQVLRKNCEEEIVRLEYDGHEADFFLSKALCEDLNVGSCYEFVLKTKHDTVKNSINNVRRLVSPQGCDNLCTGHTISAVVANDACREGKLKVWINGNIVTVRHDNLASICHELEIGSCVKLCGAFESQPGTSTAVLQIVFKAEKIIVVPDDQCAPACSGDLWKIRILDVKPDERVAICEKEDGRPIIISANLTQIKTLEVGKCYYICGIFAETRGIFVLYWFKEIPAELCEFRCSGESKKAIVTDFNCEKGFVWLIIDGKLKQWPISQELCKKLREGVLENVKLPACAQICFVDGKIVDIFILPISMCELICFGPETFARVKNIDYEKNTFFATTKDGVELRLRATPSIIAKLQIESCIKMCLPESPGPDSFFDVFYVNVVPPEQCQAELCKGTTENMTVARLDCENGFVGFKNKSNVVVQMKIDPDVCKTLKLGYCYSVCHYKSATGQEIVQFVKLVSEKPCEESACNGTVFVLTASKVDCANGYFIGYNTKRQEYKVFVDTQTCQLIKARFCYEVCAESGDGFQMKASLVKLLGEGECKDTCKKIKAYVFYSICTDTSVTIKCTDQDGTNWTLNLSKNKYDCGKVQSAKCIEFCVEVKDGRMTNTIVSDVKFLSDADCGDITSPCKDAIVWNGTFTSIDCANLKGTVKHGNDLFQVSINSNICRMLRTNTCYTLCLKYVNRMLTVVSYALASSDECSSVQCLTVKAVKACADGSFSGTTEQGVTYNIKLPRYVSCTSIIVGQCYKICGKVFGYTINAESVEKVRCFDEQTSIFEGIIYQTECSSNSFYMRTENGAEYRVLIPSGYNCASFAVQSCVVVEGWIDNESPKLIEAKTIKVVACPQPTQTWEGVVRSTNCESNIAYVAIEGTTYTVNLPKGYPCERLQSGMCVKIVGSLHPQSKIAIIATNIEIVACPQNLQTWTMFLTKYDCRTKYYLAMEGNTPRSVKLPDNFDCYSISPGSCIKVTGTLETVTGVTVSTYIKATKIEKVACPTALSMKVKIVSLNCTLYKDAPNIVVESAGVQFTCYVTMNFNCSLYSIGDCATITGYFNKEMRYVHLTGIEVTACDNEFKIKIASVHCSSRGNHVSAYIGNVLYSLYLPRGFDCNDLVVGDCYFAAGTKDDNKKTISATSLRKTRC